jgi:nucleotide-binding universal stress UspA family protein
MVFARALLAKAVFDVQGIKLAAILEEGLVPASNIITRAEEDKFHRIVMGATGTSGLTRTLMGSKPPRWWPMPPAR